MKRILFALLLVGSIWNGEPVSACTSAVISGKITPDGRPLLWKNRDTDFPQNSVKYFSGERYPFIAIVNSVEDNPTDVWIGTNSAGFSVMNTQSYNLVEIKPGEERGALARSNMFHWMKRKNRQIGKLSVSTTLLFA